MATKRENPGKPGSNMRIALRRQFVLDMRIAGFWYPQITELWNRKCEREGWHDCVAAVRTIRRDGKAILARIKQRESESAELLRTLLTLRYETALMAIQSQIRNGNLAAIKTMILINRAITELHNLAGPAVQNNQTTNVLVLTEEERARRVADLLAMAHERARLAVLDDDHQDHSVIDADPDSEDDDDPDAEDDADLDENDLDDDDLDEDDNLDEDGE